MSASLGASDRAGTEEGQFGARRGLARMMRADLDSALGDFARAQRRRIPPSAAPCASAEGSSVRRSGRRRRQWLAVTGRQHSGGAAGGRLTCRRAWTDTFLTDQSYEVEVEAQGFTPTLTVQTAPANGAFSVVVSA